MDAKRWFFYLLLVSSILACQKKEQKDKKIIDDGNSQFSGKDCYGEALTNQYVLSWSDGSYSLFHGTKDELAELLKQTSPLNKTILMAEQDRLISQKNFLSKNWATLTFSKKQKAQEGSFWQVWGQEDLQVSELWDKNIKGAGVTVAVIDGGVDLTHPSLKNRITVNDKEIPDNNLDDDENGLIDDVQGFDFAHKKAHFEASFHGTHVAGIIAAEPQESPMLGVAPETQILPLNAMISEEEGLLSLSATVFGIYYAQSRGAKIINASWGSPVCSVLLKQAIAEVGAKGTLFVTASGNEGKDLMQFPEFPASFNLASQITVGATMPSSLMAAFSNYSAQQVHILAPGYQILSTYPGGWGINSGTSMAAPFVSGLAALLWSAHPEATLEQIKTAILQSVREPKNYHPVIARGRINAPLALEKLAALLKPASLPIPHKN